MFRDNRDFYPTPRELFYKLLNGKQRYLRGRILEPSAGKGDLIKYIREHSGRNEIKIDAIEKDSRLSGLLMSEGINVVWDDFLTYETFKEYNYIIMNPPFSNGVDHALKALELAENQLSRCELYIILNKETLNNAYSDKRQELLRKLNDHNADIRYVQDGFIEAERKTNVEVALIHVKVEKAGAGKSIYDRIPFTNAGGAGASAELSTALSLHVKSSEVQARLNDIERLVLEYETACELAKKAYEVMSEKESFFNYIRSVNKDGMYSDKLYLLTSAKCTIDDLNTELDRLRSGYWQLILNTDEVKKLLTNDAIHELNKRLESAKEMEINLPNIKMLLTALSINRQDILMESLISIFKKITKHHMNQYSTNIHYYDGWKTNNAYKINKKIIYPIKWSFDWFDFSTDYDRINFDVRNFINDIIKAFQLIDPNVNNNFAAISEQEFENEILRFKMFKNGNVHIWFNDLPLLNKLNYLCGIQLNWLPSEEEIKTDTKAREFVVKEFGSGVLSVGLLGEAKKEAVAQ